ncbi:MAG TPA: hypothetical protein VN812_20490 [Candidatus Acidoferrales bacterium]|nr:hypothetical protein [Candidatus Acidoferrales bacterium]
MAVAHTLSSPALIAGLTPVQPALGAPGPVQRAIVCVGPPLFAKFAGSNWGLVLQNELPLVLVQPVPVKPHVVPSSMLWPPSVTAPPQLPPEVLLATIVLVTVTVPEKLSMPPPLLAEKVLLVIVTVPPKLPMPPPPPLPPLLPAKVLLVMVTVPPVLKMPPPPSTAP